MSLCKKLQERLGILALAFLLALGACGGGGGDAGGGTTVATGGGTGGTGVSVLSEGVMAVGSVIVNGVRFDDSAATVTIDDTTRPRGELKDGMVVKVLGTLNADNVTGTAIRVEVENEARGTVQSINSTAAPPFFTVLGQRVLVDDTTVVANIAGATPAQRVASLVAGASFVEVHGQRDASGVIHASRVELFGGTALGDELRGTVGSLGATTFVLNGVTVNFGGATITPSGATLANGVPVEVHGSFAGGVFTATRVDREDLEDAAFTPAAGGKIEVEGFVAGFTAHPGSFTVNGRAVTTSASTRFAGGTAADLANGVVVEAEGPLTAGVIVAEKLVFKRTRILVYGVATSVNALSRTLAVLNRTVNVDDLTDVRPRSGSGLAAIPAGNRVEVRGYLNTSGALIAERIDDKGSGGGSDLIQARVTAENEAARSLTLLGGAADLAGGAVAFRDASGASITPAAFFAAVTPAAGTTPGTLVKLKGTFAGTTLVVDEAELEN